MLQHAGRWFLIGAAALFISSAGAQPSQERLAACADCHGADGNSALAGVPSLAGQPRVFLENYLVLSREGMRGSEAMQKLLLGVADKEIAALATHFSGLKAKPAAGDTDKALFRRGRELAQKNRCGNCHMPDYSGQSQMPRLAGQREEFLFQMMIAYQKNGVWGGDTMMNAVLRGIPEPDVKALAHFLARSK